MHFIRRPCPTSRVPIVANEANVRAQKSPMLQRRLHVHGVTTQACYLTFSMLDNRAGVMEYMAIAWVQHQVVRSGKIHLKVRKEVAACDVIVWERQSTCLGLPTAQVTLTANGLDNSRRYFVTFGK